MRVLPTVVAAWMVLVCAVASTHAESVTARSSDAPLTAAQEHALQPRDSFKECAACPEMVVVPAGSFTMGSPPDEEYHEESESPQHVVTIGQRFAVGRFHVTRDQFVAFVTKNPDYRVHSTSCDWRNPGYAQDGSHPVVCISWDDANAYVDWLAHDTGKDYRLLSEAEFEYAARAQTSPGKYPRFWFGDDDKDLCSYAHGASCQPRARTVRVGSHPANAFGLSDMAGNAWQWTADCWHRDYNGAPGDGSSWLTHCRGSTHIIRGGGWFNGQDLLRAASRIGLAGEIDGNGVRVARTLTP